MTHDPAASAIAPVEADLRWWAETMNGRPDTPWRKGTQALLIRAADEIEQLRAALLSSDRAVQPEEQPHCENCGAPGVDLQGLMCRSCWTQEPEGPPFHWRDGVYFQRVDQGAVLMTLPGVWKVIPANEWASIVAHVSAASDRAVKEPDWREKFEKAVSITVPLGCERQPHLSRICERGTYCCGIHHLAAEGLVSSPARPMRQIVKAAFVEGYVAAVRYPNIGTESAWQDSQAIRDSAERSAEGAASSATPAQNDK